MPSVDSWTILWVTLAVVAGVIEMAIPHFGVIFISLGAVAAGIAAYLALTVPVQIVLFIVVVGVGFAVLRPWLLAGMNSRGVPSRTETLIGREGIVTLDIESAVGAGRVNVEGQDWAARAVTPLAAGTRVKVVSADGIVLEVKPA